MTELYKSKYYSDLTYFVKRGWTIEEVNYYFPVLENLSAEQLFELHRLCHITMYSSLLKMDKEQAIHVLVNPHDTRKATLLNALKGWNA